MALVYVTDDEPNICKLVAFGLKDEGFETATFTDGNSLLEAIQKRKPDAIILDWMMPPPDGLTICRSLRSRRLYCKTVWRKRSLRTCTRGAASYRKSSSTAARRKN